MGRGRRLTEKEKGMIQALTDDKKSVMEIERRTGRSRKAIRNYQQALRFGRKPAKVGPPRKLSKKLVAAMVRKARTGEYSANDLRKMYDAPVTLRRVQQILQEAEHLEYKRMLKAPLLTIEHKKDRVKWAEESLRASDRVWQRTIWSDEKKFNLDGPDGCAKYWADTRLPRRYFSRRQNGGDSIMVWGAFSALGKAELVFVETTMNAQKYCDVLELSLIPFGNDVHNGNYYFQQDNASVHVANYTKQFLQDMNIDFLDWPARSPDLNPIENLWAVLVREVYRGFRHFDDVESLKEAILYGWENIEKRVLLALVRSMKQRCIDVITKRGGPIAY